MTSPSKEANLLESVPSAESLLGPYGSWPYVDRRSGSDRRAQRTHLFSRYMLTGQRARGRRKGEGQNVYVDLYTTRDVWLCLWILFLNILDAIFTLIYLGKGGQEANPVAQHLLDMGIGWFTFSKAAVVALCVLFLLVHKTFRCVRPALYALLAFYGALFVYHVVLQLQLLFR